MTRFRFVVPVRNAERWIGRCIGSIRSQRRRDFRAVVLDDVSTDGTFEAALRAAGGDDRFLVERAAERRWPLGSIVAGVRRMDDDPEDVILLVDGDDWLAHDRALDVVAGVYASGPAWITYGSHRRWKGGWRDRLGLRRKRGVAAPYPPEAAAQNRWRALPWRASHLRTFKRFLWDGIRDADLRDEDGGYYKVAADMATMFPMLEMAGPEHAVYVHEMLYVYNHANPAGEERVAQGEQILGACRIRLRRPYERLVRP